jgi:citrate lyase beta subunit
MAVTPTPRSLLFAPGTDARKLAKLLAGNSSLPVADLEDSVVESEKDAARDVVRSALAGRDAARPCAIRVNALDTPHAAADLALCVELGVDAVVVPKCHAADLASLDVAGLPPVLAIIETPQGLQESAEIARIPGVWAMILGGVDLGRLLRWVPRADAQELLFARSKLVLDSAAAGIAPPIDVVHTQIAALDALEEEARFARSLGFGGKACIHPKQVEVVERAFAPSPEEIAWARAVADEFSAAQRAGLGAVRVAGEMVDLPVYERALELLSEEPRRPT